MHLQFRAFENILSKISDPYGREPPQYPNPNAPIYPQLYNPVNSAVPGQPGFPAPGQPGFPVPGQNAYGYQPGFPYPYQPGQPGQATMPPSAMSYPGMPATTATAPSAPSYGYLSFPNITPTPTYGGNLGFVYTDQASEHSPYFLFDKDWNVFV